MLSEFESQLLNNKMDYQSIELIFVDLYVYYFSSSNNYLFQQRKQFWCIRCLSRLYIFSINLAISDDVLNFERLFK